MGDGPGRRRRWPLGVLGAAAFVALLESAVFPACGPGTFIAASWVETGRAAGSRDLARPGGVLLLGDSQVKCGLQPTILARQLGRPVTNLAVVGGQAPGTAALFDRAWDAGARPRAVVVGVYPGLLAADLTINTDLWPELLSPAGCASLLLRTRDAKLAAPVLLRTALVSLRRRPAVRAATFAALTGRPDAAAAKAEVFRRNWGRHAGAHVLAVNPGFRDGPPAESDPKAAARWRPKPENLDALRGFLRRARGRGVAVYWLLPTDSPALRASRAKSGLEAPYLALINRLQAEFPGLTVLDPAAVLADPSVFSDPCHVDRRGAAALSLAVADVLARDLGAAAEPASPAPVNRRISLYPPPADRLLTAAAALEDVDQSAARLAAAGGPVRR